MPKAFFHLLPALVIASVVPCITWAMAEATRIQSIVDSAVRPLIAEHQIPGMALAVTVKGQPFFFNYGEASIEDKTPVTEHTLFEVGSISKVFTATLAAYAEATGRLSLKESPAQYLPQLEETAVGKVSLLQLGTYTAGGLPLQFPEEITDTAQAIEYFERWKPDTAAGSHRRYSNPSIGLFGHITALALDRDFAQAMEGLLFPELGLSHSFIHVPPARMDDYAWGYNKENRPIRVTPGALDGQAYGVKTTAADLIRFVQANIDPSKLVQPMRQAVERTQVSFFEVGPMVQGLGWEQYPYLVSLERLLAGNASSMAMASNPARPLNPPEQSEGPVLFNKTGSTNGFGAYAVFVPDEQVGIVMLANKNFPIPARVTAAHNILQQLMLDRAAFPSSQGGALSNISAR